MRSIPNAAIQLSHQTVIARSGWSQVSINHTCQHAKWIVWHNVAFLIVNKIYLNCNAKYTYAFSICDRHQSQCEAGGAGYKQTLPERCGKDEPAPPNITRRGIPQCDHSFLPQNDSIFLQRNAMQVSQTNIIFAFGHIYIISTRWYISDIDFLWCLFQSTCCIYTYAFFRLLLAALHYNCNSDREQKVDVEGNPNIKIKFPKFKKGGFSIHVPKGEPIFGMFIVWDPLKDART